MKIFVCTCTPSEVETFAQNGYILDDSPLWTTAPSSPALPASPASSFSLPHPDTYNLSHSVFSPTISGHFASITRSTTKSTMPGSFHHDDSSASSSDGEEEDNNAAEYENENRGRSTTKKILPNLGREILGLTVLTERGRRWNIRNRESTGVEGDFVLEGRRLPKRVGEGEKGRGRFGGKGGVGRGGWWGW